MAIKLQVQAPTPDSQVKCFALGLQEATVQQILMPTLKQFEKNKTRNNL